MGTDIDNVLKSVLHKHIGETIECLESRKEKICQNTVKPQQSNSLATVNDDVLRSDPAFQHAHLGVVTSATEQTWGLDAEVSYPLLVVVHDAKAILLEETLILPFDFLQVNSILRIRAAFIFKIADI